MVPVTKTTRAMAVSTMTLPTPKTRRAAAATTPASTGVRKFRFRFCAEARRQAMSGPTPIRKSRARKMGMLTRLKKGAPTLTLIPRMASESRGNTVPKKTVKVAAMRKRLFRRKADSRETTESSSPCPRRRSTRAARSEKEPRRTTPRKVRKKSVNCGCDANSCRSNAGIFEKSGGLGNAPCVNANASISEPITMSKITSTAKVAPTAG